MGHLAFLDTKKKDSIVMIRLTEQIRIVKRLRVFVWKVLIVLNHVRKPLG